MRTRGTDGWSLLDLLPRVYTNIAIEPDLPPHMYIHIAFEPHLGCHTMTARVRPFSGLIWAT